MSKGKVFVAMSGGVDSSVAAALLQNEGYEITGVTMYLDESGQKAVDDAKSVCAVLKIPHVMLDLRSDFQRMVVKPFFETYLSGRTPNPCVTCNQTIKFGVMLQKTLAMGADFLATGHYAKIMEKDSLLYLTKSAAGHKDQTYFLYTLNQHQLSHTLFPLCDLNKGQVREIAQRLMLPVYQKPDSQEICFIKGCHGDFIAQSHPLVPGNFTLENGEIVGRHKGIAYYTIGQRKGLGIAWEHPLFVLKIDSKKNEVVLGKEEKLFQTSLVAKNTMFAGAYPDAPIRVMAKIRYGGQGAAATVSPLEQNCVRVDFDLPQRAMTAGQAAVFYDGERLLGGGMISQ